MNWIESNNLEDVLGQYMAKLALDLAKEQDINLVDVEESYAQETGARLTTEWMSGKTADEQIAYLVDKYGSESEKNSYKIWLMERA